MNTLNRGRVLAFALPLAAISAPAFAAPIYGQKDLVTDSQAALKAEGFRPATTVDPALINPWGFSRSAAGPWWVSNQGSNTSTLYNGNNGAKIPLTVAIPQGAGGPQGPTGQVFNGTSSFQLATGGKAAFIFAGLDGSITAWNGAQGTTAAVVAPPGPGRIYTGLAIGSTGGKDYIYAANGVTGMVDVYNGNFAPTTVTGGFTDPTLPAGLRPFNVQNIGGNIYVTYSIGGPNADEAPLGSGAVSEFLADGTFVRRVATGGELVSPWGVAHAPADFGAFSNALLVGNFSDEFGYINAFDFGTGAYLGKLLRENLDPLIIPYLWGIDFGNDGAAGSSKQLFFNAGIGDEEHGLFGYLAVPTPAMLSLFGLSTLGLIVARRRFKALGS